MSSPPVLLEAYVQCNTAGATAGSVVVTYVVDTIGITSPGTSGLSGTTSITVEEQHQWTEAYSIRQRSEGEDEADRPRNQTILAFLENQLGLEALEDRGHANRSSAVRGRDRP